MSQSVRLTNEMREDIARVLACRAMKRKAQRLHKDIEKFNADYWERHQSKVDKALAPLTKKDWPALMQSGILTSTQTVIPETEREEPNGACRFKAVKKMSRGAETNRVLEMAGLVDGEQRTYVIRMRDGLGIYLRAGSGVNRLVKRGDAWHWKGSAVTNAANYTTRKTKHCAAARLRSPPSTCAKCAAKAG